MMASRRNWNPRTKPRNMATKGHGFRKRDMFGALCFVGLILGAMFAADKAMGADYETGYLRFKALTTSGEPMLYMAHKRGYIQCIPTREQYEQARITERWAVRDGQCLNIVTIGGDDEPQNEPQN